MPGSGELVFEKSGGKTVLARAYARSPLKWVRTLHRAKAAWVYAGSLGGGLVGGDYLRLRVEVLKGAFGFVTTQASTKVYRSGTPARQELEARVEGGGQLVWLPDPVVCFEDSDYGQRQDFHLEPGAGLVLFDALSSGRRSRGERWKFRGYSNRTRIFEEGKTVFYDALELSPRDGSLPERLGRFNLLASVVVYGAPFHKYQESIFKEWAPPAPRGKPPLLEYMGRVGKLGFLWRLAAENPEEIAGLVRQRLSFLCELLGDDPWARKLNF